MKLYHDDRDMSPNMFAWTLLCIGLGVILVLFFGGAAAFVKAFNRYQLRMDEQNQVTVNNIRIRQQAQLIKVEQQKAEIRVVEAGGIAQAQKIINATLTDKYLQHEAIQSQRALADSPNHTTVYIPSTWNGLPIVRTEP